MMCKIPYSLLFILCIFCGCKQDNKSAKAIKKDVLQGDSFKRTLSEGDYAFELAYDSNTKVTNLKVKYKRSEISQFDFQGKAGDEVFLDLNKDGNKEFYFTTKMGNEANIQAFHLVDGKLLRIIKEDYNIKSQYQIYDYTFVRGQLVEKYRVKLEGNKTGLGQSEYNLDFTKKGWELLPQGWHPSELSGLEGQYASRDATGAGYYKVMMIRDNGGGEFNVDIKVKRNGDKKILCDFNGNGYFLDRNLMVPLSQGSAELKGTLKISLLGLQAAVFTENSEDSKEMVSFCEGVGSIAGNFKKTDI